MDYSEVFSILGIKKIKDNETTIKKSPTIGEKIRCLRKISKLTQVQLAEKIGCSDSAIRNYELGNRIPDEDTIIKIAEALEISYHFLENSFDPSPDGIFQHILQLPGYYPLTPVKIDGEIYLSTHLKEYDNCNPCFLLPEYRSSINMYKLYNKYIEDWYEAYSLFAETDPNSYALWLCKYPKYAHIENGKLVLENPDKK